MAKYAAMICAAGNHNLIMEGSPGCGKSMISKRLQYIMPPMNLKRFLEKAKLQALDFKEVDFKPIRAFRSPSSFNKIFNFWWRKFQCKNGRNCFSNGWNFVFDELPHFSKSILEALENLLKITKF